MATYVKLICYHGIYGQCTLRSFCSRGPRYVLDRFSSGRTHIGIRQPQGECLVSRQIPVYGEYRLLSTSSNRNLQEDSSLLERKRTIRNIEVHFRCALWKDSCGYRLASSVYPPLRGDLCKAIM